MGHRVSQALHLVDEMGAISLAAHVRLVVEKLSLRLGSKVRLNNWWAVIVLLSIGGDEVRNSINVLSRGGLFFPVSGQSGKNSRNFSLEFFPTP